MKPQLLLLASLLVPSAIVRADELPSASPVAELPDAERIGPARFSMPNLARYSKYQEHPPQRDYPIPQEKISRATYMRWLEESGHLRYVDKCDQLGLTGPTQLMPVLAKYVESGERHYGEACLTMLHAFDRALREEVERTGWHFRYMFDPGYVGLYARYLERGGLLDPQKDCWYREMVLFMARHLHVWGTAADDWRGPMHRAQSDGTMKALAAHWFPDAPEAEDWKKYADTVYQDWWRYKDGPPNDTGYFFGWLAPLFLRAELLGDDEFFTHPEMRQVWDRVLYEVSPDGIILAYGAQSGWNATAARRLYMLEQLARKTGDGRFRFAAHKLMNYLLYQQDKYRRSNALSGVEGAQVIALAWLMADDTIEPVEPEAGSRLLYRKETLRIADKQAAEKYLGKLDPRPNKNQICCDLIVTDRAMPAKLVLRSGWNPGDLFALVDLFPRHDPLNAPGLLGLTRWGSGLTATISAKGKSDENRLMIRDLSGTAPLRLNTDPALRDPYYQEVDIEHFEDLEAATFARVVVHDYQGLPVRYAREFLFIKNRFLVMRDIPHFEASFEAEVAPVFNTQNVGPQVGRHWANTFVSTPFAARVPLRNPPFDLLVYFAPQAECRLQVVDRTIVDPRALYVPAQLRYRWQGPVEAGQELAFTQLLLPQPPEINLAQSNAAGQAVQNERQEMDHKVQVVKDTPELTILRLQLRPACTEWIICNPTAQRVEAGGVVTQARYAYLKFSADELVTCAASEAARPQAAPR